MWLLACLPPPPLPQSPPSPTVAFSPGSSLDPDPRLQAAVEELVASATRPEARLTSGAVRLALARAGVPSNPSLFLDRDQAPLWSRVPDSATAAAAAQRDFEGGASLRVVAYSQTSRSLSEMPLQLETGESLWLRVGGEGHPRLLVAGPRQELDGQTDPGPVSEQAIRPGNLEKLPPFLSEGEYRLEVVEEDQVQLLWSIFVGISLPDPSPLPGPAALWDSAALEDWVFDATNRLRVRYNLPSMRRWPLMEPLLKQQARCLLRAKVLAHTAPGCPSMGIQSSNAFYPRPRLREDLAIADSPMEAWEQLMGSPGHVQNLLCTTCTAVSLGAAPSPSGHHLLLIDLLEFPSGEPRLVRPPSPPPDR